MREDRDEGGGGGEAVVGRRNKREGRGRRVMDMTDVLSPLLSFPEVKISGYFHSESSPLIPQGGGREGKEGLLTLVSVKDW